jgi:hypothetical protein
MRRPSLAALLLLALGCTGRPPRYPITDPAMALRHVTARDARVHRIRAHGSADHFGPQGRIRGEVYVFVERPDRVRVDTRAFGTTVSTLLSDGQHLAMADLRGGNFYVGDARPCVAAQLLGIPMESAEVVAVLSGGPPLLSGDLRMRWDDDHYVIDVAGRDGASESLWMEITDAEREGARPDAQRPRPTRAELRDARGVRAVLSFEDYTEVDGVPFPRRVRVEIERDHIDLVVRYREITLDPELPDDVFDQTPNPGLPVTQVDCSGSAVPPPPPPAADAGVTGGAAP